MTDTIPSQPSQTTPGIGLAGGWDEIGAPAETGTCRNCSTSVLGRYCHACGQLDRPGRFQASELLREIPGQLLSLERGLWFTFLSLFRSPGLVCWNYVSGRRRPYVSPLSYFLLGASAQLISLWFTAPIIRETMVKQLEVTRQDPAQAKTWDRLNEWMGGDPAIVMSDVYVTSLAQSYTYQAFLCFALPLAILLWGGQRLSGARFNLAETLVFAMYYVAHCLLVTAVTTPIVSRMGSTAQLITAQGFYVLFALWAHRHFFPPTPFAYLTTLFALLISMSFFFFSLIVVFIISLIVHAIG